MNNDEKELKIEYLEDMIEYKVSDKIFPDVVSLDAIKAAWSTNQDYESLYSVIESMFNQAKEMYEMYNEKKQLEADLESAQHGEPDEPPPVGVAAVAVPALVDLH